MKKTNKKKIKEDVPMDLTKFQFPPMTDADMAFPTFDTNQELLKEAIRRGFYNGDTPYNKLFSNLFFRGGKVDFKKNVDKTFQTNVWKYLKCFMGSWAPKHEEKDAICAMLLSEIVEPNLLK